jgi:hypothetical protein
MVRAEGVGLVMAVRTHRERMACRMLVVARGSFQMVRGQSVQDSDQTAMVRLVQVGSGKFGRKERQQMAHRMEKLLLVLKAYRMGSHSQLTGQMVRC